MRRALAVALLAVALPACAEKISRTDLLARIQSGDPPPIVDVRSAGEYREGHVPGALHVPFYSAIGRADEIPAAQGAEPVVLYCEHGPRAGLARMGLWLTGLGRVVYLEGHMTAWRADGLPIETASEQAD